MVCVMAVDRVELIAILDGAAPIKLLEG